MDFKIYGDRNGSLEGEGTRLTKEVPAGLGAGGGLTVFVTFRVGKGVK